MLLLALCTYCYMFHIFFVCPFDLKIKQVAHSPKSCLIFIFKSIYRQFTLAILPQRGFPASNICHGFPEIKKQIQNAFFTPTAFKRCAGIAITHNGIQLCRLVVRQLGRKILSEMYLANIDLYEFHPCRGHG